MMIPVDTSTRAGRMLSAGRVTVTFKSPTTGEHITLIAKCRSPKQDGSGWEASTLAETKLIFIEVPNETGWNDKVAKITARQGLVPMGGADPARVWCAKQLLRFVAGQPTAPGLEVYEESFCGACGKALTDPISIERGIGPTCYGAATGSKHESKVRSAPSAPAAPRTPSTPQPRRGFSVPMEPVRDEDLAGLDASIKTYHDATMMERWHALNGI